MMKTTFADRGEGTAKLVRSIVVPIASMNNSDKLNFRNNADGTHRPGSLSHLARLCALLSRSTDSECIASLPSQRQRVEDLFLYVSV
jgi:hypothetical protein